MGRSGIPYVASGLTIASGQFGPYIRTKHNTVKSSRLRKFHSCVRSQMLGKTGSAQQIRESLAQAARSCAGGRGAAPVAGRRMRSRF